MSAISTKNCVQALFANSQVCLSFVRAYELSHFVHVKDCDRLKVFLCFRTLKVNQLNNQKYSSASPSSILSSVHSSESSQTSVCLQFLPFPVQLPPKLCIINHTVCDNCCPKLIQFFFRQAMLQVSADTWLCFDFQTLTVQ